MNSAMKNMFNAKPTNSRRDDILLVCKGWYSFNDNDNNTIEKLRMVVAYHSGTDPKYVKNADIFSIVFNDTFDLLFVANGHNNPKYILRNIFETIDPESPFVEKDISYSKRLIVALTSQIACLQICNDTNIFINMSVDVDHQLVNFITEYTLED